MHYEVPTLTSLLNAKYCTFHDFQLIQAKKSQNITYGKNWKVLNEDREKNMAIIYRLWTESIGTIIYS